MIVAPFPLMLGKAGREWDRKVYDFMDSLEPLPDGTAAAVVDLVKGGDEIIFYRDEDATLYRILFG